MAAKFKAGDRVWWAHPREKKESYSTAYWPYWKNAEKYGTITDIHSEDYSGAIYWVKFGSGKHMHSPWSEWNFELWSPPRALVKPNRFYSCLIDI
jgi:hypothetical protein